MTAGEYFRTAEKRLCDAGISGAAVEARAMLCAGLGADYDEFYSLRERELSPVERERLDRMFFERLAGKPAAYICGEWEFFGLGLTVTEDVLIPRADTEVLVEEVLRSAGKMRGQHILDLCCGSGCIGIAAAKCLDARVILSDISPAALRVAEQNARRHLPSGCFSCECRDARIPREECGAFDFVLSNPPYIPEAEYLRLEPSVRAFEPRLALVGEEEGLEFYRRIPAAVFSALKPGGLLVMECGLGEAEAVAQLCHAAGYRDIKTVKDTAGIDRVISARRPASAIETMNQRSKIMARKLFTSESVTEGHPDKICDQISDAVLDAILEKDPYARVACETTCTTGLINIMGEITADCYVDISGIARSVVLDIGYDRAKYGFDGNTCAVVTSIDEQSGDIAMGVNRALEHKAGDEDYYNSIGAGDQGMMFGYACDETRELMPLPIALAQKMAMKLTEVRKNGKLPYLRPDGKTQVTIAYEDGVPVAVDTVVVSSQHAPDVSLDTIREDITREVILPTLPALLSREGMKIYVNPTGRFVIGGPQGDSGLTGRKIIVDTYGGYARHGGGAFSGKDPTKVDRSASYAARYVAKNVVAAGLASRCEIQIAYAIGVAKPVSVMADTFGTGKVSDEALSAAIEKVFELRPAGIIDTLDLRRPIYRKLAAYGHMGREDLHAPWERTDKVDALKAALGL